MKLEKIVVKNLRDEKCVKPYQFKVDRSSALGNRFIMHNESERESVILDYKIWLWNHRDNQEIKDNVNKLLEAWHQYGKLELFCWCAPKACHAEVIKDYLNWLIFDELLTDSVGEDFIACANCGEQAIIGKRCECGYIN